MTTYGLYFAKATKGTALINLFQIAEKLCCQSSTRPRRVDRRVASESTAAVFSDRNDSRQSFSVVYSREFAPCPS
jgi:hypothetical protein